MELTPDIEQQTKADADHDARVALPLLEQVTFDNLKRYFNETDHIDDHTLGLVVHRVRKFIRAAAPLESALPELREKLQFKPVMQTRFGEPEGNCFAACVASILGCELTDIPDFENQPAERNWLEWFNEGLHDRGFDVAVFYRAVSAEDPLNAYIPLDCYFIAGGPGPRGVLHSVVFKVTAHQGDVEAIRSQTDKLVHDPHPDGDGIVSLRFICLLLKR